VDWTETEPVESGRDGGFFRTRFRGGVITRSASSKELPNLPAPYEPPPCPCPVCRLSPPAVPYTTVDSRNYLRCGNCDAKFLDPKHRLPLDLEKQRYELHENDAQNDGYRKFLATLLDPLLLRLVEGGSERALDGSTGDTTDIEKTKKGDNSALEGSGGSSDKKKKLVGLDYGCGPGPVLGLMLRENGFELIDWDPIFVPDDSAIALGKSDAYDFITCTEVAEHFYDPSREFDTMNRLLKHGGVLAVLTSFQPTEKADFEKWHYIRDPTHVVFYSKLTFEKLAEERGWVDVSFPGKNVVIARTSGARIANSTIPEKLFHDDDDDVQVLNDDGQEKDAKKAVGRRELIATTTANFGTVLSYGAVLAGCAHTAYVAANRTK
jgi:SAM-dependent methyltransferase